MTGKLVAGGRGLLSWVKGEEARSWRRRARENVFNTEGRRVVLESSTATDKSLEAADVAEDGSAIIEKPRKLAPSEWATPREVVESETAVVAEQWLYTKRTNPEAFRRRLADLRKMDPIAYGHMTDDQLEDAVVSVLRKAVVERIMAQTWETGGFADRMWKPDIGELTRG